MDRPFGRRELCAHIAIVAALSCLALGSISVDAATADLKAADIGDPPTFPLGQPDEGEKTTPEYVIGRGRDFEGPVELIAYGWKSGGYGGPPQSGVCIWASYLLHEHPFFQTCVLDDESRAGGAVEVKTGTAQLQPKDSRWTSFGGRLAPTVAGVRVTFRRPGREKIFRVSPIVARVHGDLQRKLKLPQPIGFYTVRVAGLIPQKLFKVQPVGKSGAPSRRATPNRPF